MKIWQVALSDTSKDDIIFYYQARHSGFSGLRRHRKSGYEVKQLITKSKRLDDIVPPSEHIDFIKIDVEGGELDVFRGANEILQRCQPHILFECTRSGLAAFGFTSNEIFEFLTQQHSYSIFLIKDWLDDKEPLDFEQFYNAMRYPFQALNFIATT